MFRVALKEIRVGRPIGTTHTFHLSLICIIMIMRSFEDVQNVYIRKFAKCFFIFENPFIILKSISFIFIRHVKINGSPVSLTENSAVFRKKGFF